MLDIWATWCGPCKAMIPHEREMVERLKDKPFALVSISIDDEEEDAQRLPRQGKDALDALVERHAGGGIVETWDVRYYPDDLRARCPGRDPPQGPARRGAGKGGEFAARRGQGQARQGGVSDHEQGAGGAKVFNHGTYGPHGKNAKTASESRRPERLNHPHDEQYQLT